MAASDFGNHTDDLILELQTTAERVERFRTIHEDAVRDLRDKIAAARAAGCDHAEIDEAIRRARQSVGRFTRLAAVEDLAS
jgi:hypothetical protein